MACTECGKPCNPASKLGLCAYHLQRRRAAQCLIRVRRFRARQEPGAPRE